MLGKIKDTVASFDQKIWICGCTSELETWTRPYIWYFFHSIELAFTAAWMASRDSRSPIIYRAACKRSRTCQTGRSIIHQIYYLALQTRAWMTMQFPHSHSLWISLNRDMHPIPPKPVIFPSRTLSIIQPVKGSRRLQTRAFDRREETGKSLIDHPVGHNKQTDESEPGGAGSGKVA